MTSEAREIAARLTKAQARWVMLGRQPGGNGKWPVQNALVAKGLAKTCPWHWTPLGLAVRAELERQEQPQ